MATAEPAPASLGPRYAPDDPTLPKPWKGLIDGSTGLLYYWNPETNITQYERPASLAPPLPPGPPPGNSTPKLAPIPMGRTLQSNSQQVQQMNQTPQPQVQQMSQTTQPHGQQVPPQGSQMPQPLQQQGQLMQQQARQQMMQHPGQQMPPQHHGQQMPSQQGQQFPHQQLQQMPYQQTPPLQGQQMSQQHAHQFAHQQGHQFPSQLGQQFPPQQVQKMGFPQRDDVEFQPGKQIGISPSHIQQDGVTSLHNMPPGSHSVQIPQMGVQSGSSSVNVAQTQLPRTGNDPIYQQQMSGPMVKNQMGPAMMHYQQSGGPPIGLNMGNEEDLRGRAGNDFFYNVKKEGPVMVPQQPKLSSVPMARNQQELRVSGVPPQSATPGHVGGLSSVAGHTMPNMYHHSAGGEAFSNNIPMRPPSRMLATADITNLSPADAYRRQHEVTATGDNVPAPFMTFEATGFPPEILREMRYLLQKRSICRRLHCYTHPDVQQLLCPLGMKNI